MKRDAQLARVSAPMVAKVLALTTAKKARTRLAGANVHRHVQITDFDPLDPVMAADPYPHYRELLAGERVHYNPRRDVYILHRYSDVRAAARNHEVLSSARGVTFSQGSPPFLPTSDQPEHTRMRKQLSPGMTRSALESWRPLVEQLAREVIGELLAKTPADVVSTVATPMTMRTITNVLGVAGGDEDAFRRLSNQAIRITDVSFSVPGLVSLVQGITGFRRLRALFTHRRDNGTLPDSTVLGQLAAHAEHGRLSDSELSLFAVLLMVAGFETSANMISTLFLTLANHPDQLELLAQRPELIRRRSRNNSASCPRCKTSAAPRAPNTASARPSSRPARWCCWRGVRPTATRSNSRTRMSFAPTATRPGISRSAPASTDAPGLSWRGWRARRCSARSSPTSTGSTSWRHRRGRRTPISAA